jgi:hypothetical protein
MRFTKACGSQHKPVGAERKNASATVSFPVKEGIRKPSVWLELFESSQRIEYAFPLKLTLREDNRLYYFQ